MNNTVCWVDIPVRDLNRAMKFYSSILGVPIELQKMADGNELGVLPGVKTGVSGCLFKSMENQPSTPGPLVFER